MLYAALWVDYYRRTTIDERQRMMSALLASSSPRVILEVIKKDRNIFLDIDGKNLRRDVLDIVGVYELEDRLKNMDIKCSNTE